MGGSQSTPSDSCEASIAHPALKFACNAIEMMFVFLPYVVSIEMALSFVLLPSFSNLMAAVGIATDVSNDKA